MAFRLNVFTGTFDIVTKPAAGGGVVRVGPTGDRNITIWSGNSADTIQDSKASVQPGGAVVAQGFITNRNVTSTVNVGPGQAWIAPSLSISPGAAILLDPDSKLIII